MKKILIVDDQQAWIDFNKQAVIDVLGNDIQVDTSSSAQEAYNILLENFSTPYDCIITDMQMEEDYDPKMAGEWLIEQIKPLPPYERATIIVISASPKAKIVAETLGVDCIPKSVAVASTDAYKSLLVK